MFFPLFVIIKLLSYKLFFSLFICIPFFFFFFSLLCHFLFFSTTLTVLDLEFANGSFFAPFFSPFNWRYAKLFKACRNKDLPFLQIWLFFIGGMLLQIFYFLFFWKAWCLNTTHVETRFTCNFQFFMSLFYF